MADSAPRSPSGTPARARSPWTPRLSTSVFSFAFPDLEELYQAYFTSNSVLWTAGTLTHGLVGCVVFGLHYFSASPAQVSQLPPLWWLGIGFAPLLGATLAIVLLRPAFYAAHRRTIAALFHLCSALNYRRARTMLLWSEYVSGSGAFTTWAERVHAFSVENVYLMMMGLTLLALPMGQALDLAFLTAALAVEGLNNRYVCGLPFAGQGLFSLHPKPLGAASLVSRLMSGGALRLDGAEPTEACPAVLWLWQLVGWWLTCHVLLVAEILWRRAFLRTPAAEALLGPAQVADALSWPFCHVRTVQSVCIISAVSSWFVRSAWLVGNAPGTLKCVD